MERRASKATDLEAVVFLVVLEQFYPIVKVLCQATQNRKVNRNGLLTPSRQY